MAWLDGDAGAGDPSRVDTGHRAGRGRQRRRRSGLSKVAGRCSRLARPAGHTMAHTLPTTSSTGHETAPRLGQVRPGVLAVLPVVAHHPQVLGRGPRPGTGSSDGSRAPGQVVGLVQRHAVDRDPPWVSQQATSSPGSPITRFTRCPPVGHSPTASSVPCTGPVAGLHGPPGRASACESSKTTTSPRWMSPFQYDTFSTTIRSSCSNSGRIDPDGTKKLCTRNALGDCRQRQRDDHDEDQLEPSRHRRRRGRGLGGGHDRAQNDDTSAAYVSGWVRMARWRSPRSSNGSRAPWPSPSG